MATPPSTLSKRPSGMTAFTIVWGGQIVSVLASTMTQLQGVIS